MHQAPRSRASAGEQALEEPDTPGDVHRHQGRGQGRQRDRFPTRATHPGRCRPTAHDERVRDAHDDGGAGPAEHRCERGQGEGGDERRRCQVASRQRARAVLQDHGSLAAPVPAVLAAEREQVLAHVPVDLHAGVVGEAVADGANPVVEVDVLVGTQLLVPSVHGPRHRRAIHRERGVVGVGWSQAVVVDRVADPDPAGERERDGPPDRGAGDADTAAPDAGQVMTGGERGDPSPEVVDVDAGVPVDAGHDRSGRGGQADVEGRGDHAGRVVEQPHPFVLRRHGANHLAGAVLGAPVDDEHLQPRMGLDEHGAHGDLDRGLLVAHRHDHRDQRRLARTGAHGDAPVGASDRGTCSSTSGRWSLGHSDTRITTCMTSRIVVSPGWSVHREKNRVKASTGLSDPQ